MRVKASGEATSHGADIAEYARSDCHPFVSPPSCSAAGESLPVYKGGATAAGSEA
jgi:hypothetical protein